MKFKVMYLIFPAFFLFPISPLKADTVYLKNGKTLNGAVLQNDGNTVVVKVGNVLQRFYSAEVDKVVKDEDVPPPTVFTVNPLDFPNISSAKIQKIMRLMEVNGTIASLQKSFDQTIVMAPPDRQADLRKIFNLDEIVKKLVPILDKNYNEDDLSGLIDFYESPLGKKMLKSTPEIIKESAQVMIEYFRKKAELSPSPSSSAK